MHDDGETNNMKRLKKIIGICIYYSGLFYLLNLIEKLTQISSLIILNYHRVINLSNEFNLDKGVISATPKNFEKQIKYVSKKYNVISFDMLIDYIQNKTKLPKNPLIITFDDGYKDNYTNAYPILKKYNVLATFFLTIDFIEKKRLPWWDKLVYIINKTKISKLNLSNIGVYDLSSKEKKLESTIKINKKIKNNGLDKEKILKKISDILKVKLNKNLSKDLFLSWEDVKEMSKNDMSFGAHTLTHCSLAQVSLEKAKKEVTQSKLKIEKELNKKIEIFSYPYGEQTHFNDKIKKMLKNSKYSCAVSTEFGFNYISNKLDFFSLNRIGIQNQDNLFFFKLKLNRLITEFYFFLKKLRKLKK